MEAKIGNFPWSNDDIILACEREFAEAVSGNSGEHIIDNVMRFTWALVHSRQPRDLIRGMAMVDASFTGSSPPVQRSSILQLTEIFLLAVEEYKTNNYFMSLVHVYECLQISPDWSLALSLKKTVEDRIAEEDRIAKGGVIGIGIKATACIIVGVIVAIWVCKN